MTTLNGDDAENEKVQRIELNHPSKVFDWIFRANHWTVLTALVAVLIGLGGTIEKLNEHGEKINDIQHDMRSINQKVDQIDRDTGYLSGRLDSKGQGR